MATALRPQNTFIVLSHTPKETAYGTAVADGSIDQLYSLVEPSLSEVTREKIYDEEEIKGHEFAADNAKMATLWQDATVPLVFPGSYEVLGLIYAQALGALATAGVGPYTHTITAQDGTSSDQLPSTSFVQGIKGQTSSYEKYKGCIPNEVSVSVENRGRVNINATYFTDGSLGDASGFSVPSTLAAQTPMFGKDATFQIADAGSGLVDQTSLLRSFEVSWNNNLSREDNHSLIGEGVNLTGLRFATRSVSLTLRVWGTKGDAIWADFLADTLKDIQVAVGNGTESVTWNFDRCIIENVQDSFDDIRNVLEVTVRPFTITAAGISPVQIVVVNDISAYLA